MNTFEKIQAAAEICGIPAYPHVYTGSADKWITYQIMTERPALFGDDAPHAAVARVMINLYVPQTYNYLQLKNKLRKTLFAQGFTFPEVVNTAVEADTKIRQITMECEDDEEDFEEE